jgi:D-lyxose ketol-isomerase
MLTKKEATQRRQFAASLFQRAGIHITPAEKQRIETADFGLGQFEQTGLAVLVYVNTSRCCAKELAMWPRQTCPEHLHPPVGSEPGKEETFRCRWGKVWLYLAGRKSSGIHCRPPLGREKTYTVWRQIELNPGDQFTIDPNTLHWFQSGDEGAVVSEFSTRSTDENDIFTDPEIHRITKIA